VRGLAEFAPRLIDLVADVAMNPTLPADEIAILKQQRMQDRGAEQVVAAVPRQPRVRRALFGNPSVRQDQRDGATLQAINRDTLVAFHRESLPPQQRVIIIVGAVEPTR